MARKNASTGGESVFDIIQSMLLGNKATDAQRSMLLKLYRNDAKFGEWFDNNVGQFITISNGRVKDAKDVYNFFGFTPRPRDKDVGRGTQEMLTRSGKMTNQTGAWNDVRITKSKIGNKTMYKATPEGGRARTYGETEDVIRRGRNGVKLSLEDQRIYDKYMADRRAEEEARQRMIAQRELEKKRASDRARKFKLLGKEDDGTLDDVQVDDLVAQREEQLKIDRNYSDWKRRQEFEAEQKKAAEDAEAEAWNERWGVDAGQRLSANEKKLVEDGKKSWGYTPDVQKKIDELRSRIDGISAGGEASNDDVRALEEQYNSYLNRYRKGLQDVPEEKMTTEQLFRNTFVDKETGIRYAKTKDGIKELSRPDKPSGDTPEQKKADARAKYIRDYIENRREEYVGVDGKGKDLAPFDPVSARKSALETWNLSNEEPLPDIETCPVCGAVLDEYGRCTNPTCMYGKYYGGEDPLDNVQDDENPIQTTSNASSHVKKSYL